MQADLGKLCTAGELSYGTPSSHSPEQQALGVENTFLVRFSTPLDEANTVLDESSQRFRDVLEATAALHVNTTTTAEAVDSTIGSVTTGKWLRRSLVARTVLLNLC